MEIRANIARAIKEAMLTHEKTLSELSDEFDIPLSSLKSYASGTSNPRADTIELLADKLGLTLTELVSCPPVGVEQAETILRAAKEFSSLTPEQQAKCRQLFLELVKLFSGTELIYD